ncbi:MAG: S8 family serine peptidase [Clostridia bacterium]|nr:S8 family serine peptidase [Clostridia bacterium]
MFLIGKLCSKFILFIIFLVAMGFIVEDSLLAMDINIQVGAKKYHPKLESVLGRLAEEYSQSEIAMQKFASQRNISFENNQVRIILVPPPGEDASIIDQVSLVSRGVVIEAVSEHLMRARVPISLLEEIADEVDGISYIRLPCKPFSDMVSEESRLNLPNFLQKRENGLEQIYLAITSQGVELTRASEYHELGYKGQNTKVAVIDIGFANLTNSQNNGELPRNLITMDFTGTGLQAGRIHGTGVAEIVYDMAPEVQFYLIKIADEVDLENAKNYSIDQGVDIINHSWGWPNTNFADGTGVICDIANDARSNGIIWLNAADNLAHRHYQGFFADTNNDGWHEFSSGDESNNIEHTEGDLDVYLTWDCWPTSDQDYDLYLYDSTFNLVASSATRQTGTQEPTEKITLAYLSAGTYHIMIRKYSATENVELKLISGALEYQTPEHSIGSPADAAGAVAVGYINIGDWTTGPQGPGSSQGPTNDGRIKPDIMGPAGVSSFTWGTGNYTSAATPHVSGAAALILSRCSGFTADQIGSALEAWAIDMGASGKDSIYGSGRLRLLAPPFLSWTGEANYESDGLNPEKGATSTEFIYRVEYSDENNYAPESGYPRVHILKDGFEIVGSPFTMSEADTNDTAFTDGKLYSHTKAGLDAGTNYSYYFEAYDAHNGVSAIGDPTNEEIGPGIVLPGNLESLIVYPNPFSSLKGHSQITFAGLTSDARIRIFTLTAELMKEEEVSWQYSWTWDVKNMTGEELPRGIYLWIVTNTAGGRRIGKIAIIK